MRLGLIARMDNSGLGTQTWEFYRHMKPAATMVVDFSAMNHMQNYPQRFTEGSIHTVMGAPSIKESKAFLDEVDVVFIAERPYSFRLLELARIMGKKTIVQPNYEFAPWVTKPKLARPDVFGVPTKWHYDDFPDPKILLPVPIDTDAFPAKTPTKATRFLHVVGKPAAHDRNGTRILVEALQHVKSHIQVTICSQRRPTGQGDYVGPIIQGKTFPPNMRLVVTQEQPHNWWQLYKDQDVLIMPRRYGGLCLPVNEALGAGMPVIMPDISPNNTWLPDDWLVPAKKSFVATPGRHVYAPPIDVYDVDPKDLAAKIDQFASDYSFSCDAMLDAILLSEKHSWGELKKLYLDTFDTMLKA